MELLYIYGVEIVVSIWVLSWRFLANILDLLGGTRNIVDGCGSDLRAVRDHSLVTSHL